jgi:hypothetical protein
MPPPPAGTRQPGPATPDGEETSARIKFATL